MNKAELASCTAVDASLSGATATRHHAARRGCNPAAGEAIATGASTAASFKPGKAIRDAVDPPNR